MNQTERTEQAQRAVKVFRSMQPQLTSYARAISGKRDLRVELARGGPSANYTEGSTVFMTPPFALGDNQKHNQSLCDRRNAETLRQLCEACASRETMLGVIYHELAHICFDSLQPMSEEDRKATILRAAREGGSEKFEEEYRRLPAALQQSYIAVAKLFNPFLPSLVNALEDARVNEAMAKARPGIRVITEARVRHVFTEGVEQRDADGNLVVKPWRDYPLNAQMIIGTYCQASGYNFTGWFDPKVEQDLSDPELGILLDRFATMKSIDQVYIGAFEVLDELRRLGYCKTEEEQKKEQDEKPEQQDEEGNSNEGDPTEDSSENEEGQNEEDGSSGSADSGEDDSSDRQESEGGGSDSDAESGEEEAADSSSGAGEESNPSEGDDVGSGSDESDDGSQSENSVEEVGEDETKDAEPIDDSTDSTKSRGASEEADADESGEPVSPESGGGGVDSDNESSPERSDSLDIDPNEPEAGQETGDPGDGADEGYDTEASGSDGDESEVDECSDEPNLEDYSPEDFGSAEDTERPLVLLLGHDDSDSHEVEGFKSDSSDDQRAVALWSKQVDYFESPSVNIEGVHEYNFGSPDLPADSAIWNRKRVPRYLLDAYGIEGDFSVPESHLGPALLKMRVAFADNQRARYTRNLKSGKVNARVLGKRAPIEDPRLFKRNTTLAKKDYFVAIALDISGSTAGDNLVLTKRAAMAQAELLHRSGIKFSMFAHTGGLTMPMALDVFHVKYPHEPWSDKTEERLAELGPGAANLDGHAMEFLRKALERETATDKIALYYSDGSMPAENHREELRILQREIVNFDRLGYTLLGVGIRTDSPQRHGLDTVRVDRDEDLIKVVRHIERRLDNSR